MTTEFHVYPEPESLSIKIDKKDPQKEQILQQISEIMNQAGRSREADECRNAKTW